MSFGEYGMMKNLERGTKIRNQRGEDLTVLGVIDGTMVQTYEHCNDLYHITKIRVISN